MSNIAILFTFELFLGIIHQGYINRFKDLWKIRGIAVQYDCREKLNEIRKMREKMIESAQEKGFTSDDTIRYSQELDQLIYEYQCYSKRTGQQQDEIRIAFKQMIMILPQVHLMV